MGLLDLFVEEKGKSAAAECDAFEVGKINQNHSTVLKIQLKPSTIGNSALFRSPEHTCRFKGFVILRYDNY